MPVATHPLTPSPDILPFVSTDPTDRRRATIEKLRAENNALKEELLVESRFSVQPSDPRMTAEIEALEREADGLTKKVRGRRW